MSSIIVYSEKSVELQKFDKWGLKSHSVFLIKKSKGRKENQACW